MTDLSSIYQGGTSGTSGTSGSSGSSGTSGATGTSGTSGTTGTLIIPTSEPETIVSGSVWIAS